MRRDMRAHGLSEPRFEAGPGWFRVTFPGPGKPILDLIPEEGATDPSASSGQALRALGLNERHIEALRLMVNEKRVLTNRDYRQLFNVGNQTAARELAKLVEKGQARQIGSGRATRYETS